LSQPETSNSLFRASLPQELTDEGEPVFVEPWQAQAFAMTISLYDGGLFTWNEWAEVLSSKLSERASTGGDRNGGTYYEDWLAALEVLVSSRTEIQSSVLADLKSRWEQAYRTTPHGESVTL
jgi:nitrile hydratase accessory protein